MVMRKVYAHLFICKFWKDLVENVALICTEVNGYFITDEIFTVAQI
jgi:hypothetical protein